MEVFQNLNESKSVEAGRFEKTKYLVPERRYSGLLIGLFLAITATVIRLAFRPILDGSVSFIFYFPAVVVAAWYGGFFAGVVATILSTVAAYYFLVVPRHSFTVTGLPSSVLVTFAVFIVSSLLISFLAEVRLRSLALQRRLREELSEQKQFGEEILNSIQDAFSVIDRDWRFVYANESISRIANRPNTEILGKHVWEVFPLSASDKEHLDKAMKGRTHVHYEMQHPPTGCWFSISAYPCHKGITIYAVEISERKRMEQELAQTRAKLQQHATNLEKEVQKRTAELQESISQLETFSYTVAHDLRSPLRAMQAFAHMTLDEYGDRLDETGRDYLDRIEVAAKRMDLLIQDVIAYSRVARAELKIEPVNTEKIVEEVIQEYPSVHQPHAQFEIQHPLHNVKANRSALAQVLSNLLTNAVKFVAAGGKALVKVSTERQGETVRLVVEDKGIGIPKESIGKIFEPFQRAHSDAAYEGLGIGLAIARAAVERMKGKIGAESVVGQGSKFWIELPAAT